MRVFNINICICEIVWMSEAIRRWKVVDGWKVKIYVPSSTRILFEVAPFLGGFMDK